MKKFLCMAIPLMCFIMLVIVYNLDWKPSMTGHCLVTIDRNYLIVDEKGSPIVMSNQSNNEKLFDDLHTGDKIKITYDGINDSYPGQTGVYRCKLIKKGSIDNIPQKTLNSLEEMGWMFR